jgi:hypothetical protein
MRETSEELLWLHQRIDRTRARMNAHMAGILTPERRLSAR